MAKQILNSAPPDLVGRPSPEFVRADFDAAIWNKGYDMVIERALRCPCVGEHPRLDCQNCSGTGYFYINPLRTHVLATGINQNNHYKSWSETLLGTIAVTVRDDDKVNFSYFDRLSFVAEDAYYSENCIVRQSEGGLFVFLTYKPINVISVHGFVSVTEKLKVISEYSINSINPYTIDISDETIQAGDTLSLYYRHHPEFHILDFPHEVRSSWEKDRKTGQEKRIWLPRQAIARRSHLIAIEKPNYDGSGIQINDNV